MKLLQFLALLALASTRCRTGADAAACDGIAKGYTLLVLPNSRTDEAFLFKGDSLRFTEQFVDPDYVGTGQRHNGTFYGYVSSGASKIAIGAGFKVNPLRPRSDAAEEPPVFPSLSLDRRATSSDALLTLLRTAPPASDLRTMAQMIASKDKKLLRVPLGIYPFTLTVVVLMPGKDGRPFLTPSTNETLGVALLPFDSNEPYVIALWGEKRVDAGAVSPETTARFSQSIEIGDREKALFTKSVEVTGSVLPYIAWDPEAEKCFSASSSAVSSAPSPTSSASSNATAIATTTETRVSTSSFTIITPTGNVAPTSANARPTSSARAGGGSPFNAAQSLRPSALRKIAPALLLPLLL